MKRTSGGEKRMTGGGKKRKDGRLRREGRRKREGRAGCGTVERRVRPSPSRTQKIRRSGGETAGTARAGVGGAQTRASGQDLTTPPSIHCFQRWERFFSVTIIFHFGHFSVGQKTRCRGEGPQTHRRRGGVEKCFRVSGEEFSWDNQ